MHETNCIEQERLGLEAGGMRCAAYHPVCGARSDAESALTAPPAQTLSC
jgi:hypothetical protein